MCEQMKDRPFLGTRDKLRILRPDPCIADGTYSPYHWRSYENTRKTAEDLARGIEKLELSAQQEYEGSTLRVLGLYSKNREEWVLTDIACWMMSITTVPLYDTLGEESIRWTFEQTGLTTIFLSLPGMAKLLAMKKKGSLPSLKAMVCFDPVDSETLKKASEAGVRVVQFADVLAAGKNSPDLNLRPCKGNTLITICYTSGTTDRSKGVQLTQKNFRDSAVASLKSNIFENYLAGFGFLSYLPLAHVFERVLFYISIIGGFKVAFYHGEVTQLMDDMQAAQPVAMVGVPRVFCRFYDAIMAGINSATGWRKMLVQRAISVKLEAYKSSKKTTHWLYDRFVFGKIRKSMGGNLQVLVSSAAPLDSHILEMMRILCSVRFLEGYGQTETAGAISISYFDDPTPNSLGPPLMCCDAKVVDVPEMDYRATDIVDGAPTPRGELCVRGTSVTKGYFKDPEKTKTLYDAEGWMHTGDIAALMSNGVIRVIDRKKNMFKLQHGEYVAPEKIENVLQNSKWVLQVFIHGDGKQNYLLAVVVPNKEPVMVWAKEKGIFDLSIILLLGLKESYEELCKSNTELTATILKDLTTVSRERKVRFTPEEPW